MNKYVEPNVQAARLSKDGMMQKELIDRGIMPANVRDRITYMNKIHREVIAENPGANDFESSDDK